MSGTLASHSSKNNAEVLALRDWLDANGWGRGEAFVVLDLVRGLVAGYGWQIKLKKVANRCCSLSR